MRGVWAGIVLVVGVGACVESEPWPEAEMDAGSSLKTTDLGPRPICGDGIITTNRNFDTEDCDGDNLAEMTCESFMYESGELGCSSECLFDVSACVGGSCGNGFVDDGESCDVREVRRDFLLVCPDGGCEESLCDATCDSVAAGSCGDGIVQAPDEECDGSAFHPAFTNSFPADTYDTDTLGCVNCRIDYGDATPAVCENGRVERGEECEAAAGMGTRRNGDDRQACVDCAWTDDDSFCGDGEVQTDWYEECEGDEGEVPCRYQPDPDETIYVPCEDCRLRRSQCPDEPRPVPGLDAGPSEPDGSDATDVNPDSETAPPDSSGSESDTTGGANDATELRPDATSETDTDENGSASDGCSAGVADSASGSTWLLLLFALVGIRRRTIRSRDSLCASSGSYSSL
jgi:MYXO-CTERM domain-containing protein